jgi:hypothetical protein
LWIWKFFKKLPFIQQCFKAIYCILHNKSFLFCVLIFLSNLVMWLIFPFLIWNNHHCAILKNEMSIKSSIIWTKWEMFNSFSLFIALKNPQGSSLVDKESMWVYDISHGWILWKVALIRLPDFLTEHFSCFSFRNGDIVKMTTSVLLTMIVCSCIPKWWSSPSARFAPVFYAVLWQACTDLTDLLDWPRAFCFQETTL